MKELTLRALEGSVLKIEAICQGYGVDRGVDNCPLCHKFYGGPSTYHQETGRKLCVGCPVYASTQKECCGGTPYESWSDLIWGFSICAANPFVEVRLPALLAIKDQIENFLSRRGREFRHPCDVAEDWLVFLLSLLPEGHKWREQI